MQEMTALDQATQDKPMNEDTMKQFFQQVVDHVAQLSTQAQRVEGLEQRINELSDRLRQVEDENRNLRHELSQANSRNADVQDMLQRTQESLDSERNVIGGLRDTLIQRDSKVQEVENTLASERDAHRITTSERDDARVKIEELDREVNHFRETTASLSSERDHFREEANRLEKENVELRQRLDRINSVLNPHPSIHAVA